MENHRPETETPTTCNGPVCPGIEAELGALQAAEGHETGECPASARLQRAFLLLQEKWVFFLVHFLLTRGPSGFNEVGRCGGVNTTTLSQRFGMLEREGIVTRTVVSTFPPRTTYALTEKGEALGAVIESISGWAEEWEGTYSGSS